MNRILLVFITLLFGSYTIKAQQKTNNVRIVGEMRNVMWKGQLYGTINLDTIANKEHLYGLGPLEYLKGELMIFDGKAYQATVVSPTTIKVEESYKVKAPFFGYVNVRKWMEHVLPDSVQTLTQLELYLDKITKTSKRPFMFKLKGVVNSADLHIVNLPTGAKVSSPEEAHKGQTNFAIKNEEVDVLGFFSTDHQAIFTHHDTFLHLHLLTTDKTKMGHLDDVEFKKGSVTLYLPLE